ncbi:MAG: GNAT family N-acetyltransferase [Anaerolineae bacterium]
MQADLLIRDLGDGLVLRCATREDAEALAQFDSYIFRNAENAPLNPRVKARVYDLAARPHPTFRASDFLIVEDTRTRSIVSSSNLISQTWVYEGIRFGVGRPEIVTTNPDYRKRGLVRTQFEELHRCSAARGELVQAITGIPYFYRQFGYEMAMPLGGGRVGNVSDIPALKTGESEPLRFRQAQMDDLAFINELYEQGNKRSLVYCERTPALWQYELEGHSSDSSSRPELRIIQNRDGIPLGFIAHYPTSPSSRFDILLYELKPGVSWLQVTPSVLRYMKSAGETANLQSKVEFNQFGFGFGPDHPAYQVISSKLQTIEPPYAWYLRVPDLPAFIQRIGPVLEQRIAGSLARGYSGEGKINFYRSGLALNWEQGKLVKVEPWQPGTRDWAVPRFPGLTFLQLLFGKCSLEELMSVYTDCSGGSDEANLLLRALFPRKTSNVWPID